MTGPATGPGTGPSTGLGTGAPRGVGVPNTLAPIAVNRPTPGSRGAIAPNTPRQVMPRATAGRPLASARRGQVVPALSTPSGLGIIVEGVRSARDYGALLAYLRGIDVIQQVGVLDVQGDVVSLDIRPAGSEQAVIQAINGGYTLTPVDGARRYAFR